MKKINKRQWPAKCILHGRDIYGKPLCKLYNVLMIQDTSTPYLIGNLCILCWFVFQNGTFEEKQKFESHEI